MTTTPNYIMRPVDADEVPEKQAFSAGRPRMYQGLADALKANPDQWYWVVTPNAKKRKSTIQATLRIRYGVPATFRSDASKPEGFYIKLKVAPEAEA